MWRWPPETVACRSDRFWNYGERGLSSPDVVTKQGPLAADCDADGCCIYRFLPQLDGNATHNISHRANDVAASTPRWAKPSARNSCFRLFGWRRLSHAIVHLDLSSRFLRRASRCAYASRRGAACIWSERGTG